MILINKRKILSVKNKTVKLHKHSCRL